MFRKERERLLSEERREREVEERDRGKRLQTTTTTIKRGGRKKKRNTLKKRTVKQRHFTQSARVHLRADAGDCADKGCRRREEHSFLLYYSCATFFCGSFVCSLFEIDFFSLHKSQTKKVYSTYVCFKRRSTSPCFQTRTRLTSSPGRPTSSAWGSGLKLSTRVHLGTEK